MSYHFICSHDQCNEKLKQHHAPTFWKTEMVKTKQTSLGQLFVIKACKGAAHPQKSIKLLPSRKQKIRCLPKKQRFSKPEL